MTARAITRRRRGKGGQSILNQMLSVGLLGLIVMFFTSLVLSSKKAVKKSAEFEAAYQRAGARLYELMDLPWSDSQLTEGDHEGNPSEGIRWTVELVKPRLRQITVFAKLKDKNTARTLAESPALLGFKFHDY